MRRTVVFLLGIAVLSLACAPAAPAPAPTAAKPAAAPTAAPAATAAPKAPTAAPTAVPPTAASAKKVDYPAKGKVITIMTPMAAGGAQSLGARLLADFMSKEFGTPVEVVDRPGAGGQVGTTEFMTTAKPDGYTFLHFTLPTLNTLYLNPERKAAFTPDNFTPVGCHSIDQVMIAVRADSPFKTVTDLVNAAKANPEKIRVVNTGLLGAPDLGVLQLQRATGARFAVVHIDSAPENANQLLGGHVDAAFGFGANLKQFVTGGQFRGLAVLAPERSAFLKDIPTMEESGYKGFNFVGYKFLLAPAGTPKEIIDVASAALKKAIADPDHIQKMANTNQEVYYIDPVQMKAVWVDYDARIKPLVEEALAAQKK